MLIKKDPDFDDDQLSFNLMRRVIITTIDVYGFEDVKAALDKFIEEALNPESGNLH